METTEPLTEAEQAAADSAAAVVAEIETTTKKNVAKAKLAEQHENKIDAQFSSWDGSHRGLVEAVKNTLIAPGSFEHIETKTRTGGGWPNTFVLRMEYTAKNAYGVALRRYILVEISVDSGKIVQVFDEG